MYASERYFTMTGQLYGDCPMAIADDDGALAWIHETYVKTARAKKSRARQKIAEPLSDEELLEKARAPGSPTNPQIRWGGNSGGAAFGKLWEGQWQGDFGSQSEADLALCGKLAFWSGKNREQMERLFRQSGLMREKWDERHHASGATYGS
jgi:primase-polymerase (primpol)-like protein